MPSADQHRRKAENNRQFLATISLDDFPEWVVVAAFYIAVHVVEELRAGNGDGHSDSHEDRLEYIRNRLTAIHSPSYVLQSASQLARYQSRGDFFAQFQPEDVRDKLLPRLAQIDGFAATP
jgi:hypothetical protein